MKTYTVIWAVHHNEGRSGVFTKTVEAQDRYWAVAKAVREDCAFTCKVTHAGVSGVNVTNEDDENLEWDWDDFLQDVVEVVSVYYGHDVNEWDVDDDPQTEAN